MRLVQNFYRIAVLVSGFLLSLPMVCQSPKILHISFHKGCIKDFEEVAHELSLNVTSWYIHDNVDDFDGVSRGNVIYNISHKRAQRVWERHKEYFNSFDMIITSDTAPLSRIFLQNNWKKPLIIWVCNRFDYSDCGTREGDFPDAEYYDLFKKATKMKNVRIVAYTPYEHVYMREKGINAGSLTIKPIGSLEEGMRSGSKSAIPETIDQKNVLFIYPRLDSEDQLKYVEQRCASVGLKTYSGAYNGPNDLEGFKGIIYFPYAWSNLALFENLQRGIIHFVPTERFVRELGSKVRNCTVQRFELVEWYMPEYRPYLVYFDSWQDLKNKVNQDYSALQKEICKAGAGHRQEMLHRWDRLFAGLTPYVS